ncbi:hypothetical protein BIW11_05105 [Tropilaelaps mercedesae]|uniref:Uncharacterized protein n=1 Tax=Tropilaelaps mercedesae TaxID=418985 RepID=A0A1V9Y3N0_9ACAR|nr:hypothetical protein BIW11_05105 [Tropilaelaps mercedesae]
MGCKLLSLFAVVTMVLLVVNSETNSDKPTTTATNTEVVTTAPFITTTANSTNDGDRHGRSRLQLWMIRVFERIFGRACSLGSGDLFRRS